jgi:CHAD domain-containing protein
VLSDTIQDLQKDLSSTIPAEVFQALEEELVRQRNKVMGGPPGLIKLLKEIAAQIEAARERIYDFPISHNDFSAFEGGVFRIYRQGKQHLKDARKNPTPTLLHDMRKKMKYFWYQVEILQPIFPGPMRAYAGTLEKITEKLGEYHDLQVLQEFLNETSAIASPLINETLQEACFAKKSMLLYDIWPMASMAFSEEPKAMVSRLASYWKVYAQTKPQPLNIFPDEK